MLLGLARAIGQAVQITQTSKEFRLRNDRHRMLVQLDGLCVVAFSRADSTQAGQCQIVVWELLQRRRVMRVCLRQRTRTERQLAKLALIPGGVLR